MKEQSAGPLISLVVVHQVVLLPPKSKLHFPSPPSICARMNCYPQFTAWQFMPTYQPHPPMNLFQLQMQPMAALQHNLTPPGNGAFVTLHVPPLILRLDHYQGFSTGPHQDRAYQPERGRRKTAAPADNHLIRTSFSTITNNHRAISQHSCVGDFHNARNGSAGRPPSSGMSAMPNQKYRSHASVQNRIKRDSAIRGQRKCDDLLQYVVANNGAESLRPRKRRRMSGQQI